MNDSLLGHTEELTYLVHRALTGEDWWVQLTDEDGDELWDQMRDRVIDQGGIVYKVTAKAVVTKAEEVDW